MELRPAEKKKESDDWCPEDGEGFIWDGSYYIRVSVELLKREENVWFWALCEPGTVVPFYRDDVEGGEFTKRPMIFESD